ncbi:TIGR02444 family protein [Pseudoalteromonas sp. BDTF-M6]|uniref:TIGR02444 family protein n=1 Tax=Pseudoalteromonas sp. BDTF-M6 TaxID=2796132 RepID=UPI001BAE8107|nr:TIGR02444 family protein [Pseudoalteromonas sp. BDTF-M6]MBS3799295.1 TIGR02444 family protein [Pseudoalteromonas sp. BDTF-M6]
MSKISASEFWRFSLTVYANPQVQKALLQWQDEYDLNVNLCLLLAYLDCHQQALDSSQLQALQTAMTPFNQLALKPLRQVRAEVKAQQGSLHDYPALRQQLLDLELQFERQQQMQLVQACNTLKLRSESKANNLALYLPSSLLPLNADLDQALHAITD